MMDHIQPYIVGLFAVFNPESGHGLFESLIALIIVIGVLALLFVKIEVPVWLVGTFTFIGGAWLGGQARSNTVQSKTKVKK